MGGIPCVNEECGGLAVPVAKDGRFFEHREVYINVPADLEIPRCQKCEQDLFDDATYKKLMETLENEYQVHTAMIEDCRARFKARNQ